MLGFYFYKYTRYALFFLIVGAVALILEKEMEAVFLFVGFVSTRYLFPTTWHYTNDKRPELVMDMCILISIITFLILIPITIPFKISLFICILIGTVTSFVAYLIQLLLDLKSKPKPQVDIYTLTPAELRHYCHTVKIKPHMCDFVLMKVFGSIQDELSGLERHLTHEEISEKLSYSISTIDKWSKICKKKLNIKDWK